jgi:hypothetical protein
MILGIHQPNFLPWLGYFYKMARSDHFIFLDNVAFANGSYTNRVKIKTAQGAQWLTVPVQKKGLLGQPIIEVTCSDRVDWRRKTVSALETNYRPCPFYKQYAPGLVEILSKAGDNLADLNIRLIEYLAAQLGITTPTTRSSTLKADGFATTLLMRICKEVGADTYLSGEGGKNYHDERAFGLEGLNLLYMNFKHPTYEQRFGEFQPGMSIVDLLFNMGPESRRVLGVDNPTPLVEGTGSSGTP